MSLKRALAAALALVPASTAAGEPAVRLHLEEPVVLSAVVEGRFYGPKVCPGDDAVYAVEAVGPSGSHPWIVFERTGEVREVGQGGRGGRAAGYYAGQVAWCPWSPREGEHWFAFASSGSFGNTDVYLGSTGSETALRLTADPGVEWQPAWSPDGDRLVFLSAGRGSGDVACLDGMREVMLAGEGATLPEARFLTEGPEADLFPSFSPDGRWLVFSRRASMETGFDLYLLDLNEGSEPVAMSRMAGAETRPSFSPDGRWIACFYSTSVASTRVDLYVTAVPIAAASMRLLAKGVDPEPETGPAWSGIEGSSNAILFVSGEGDEKSLRWVDPARVGSEAGGGIESEVELVSGLDFSGGRGILCGQRDGEYCVLRGSLAGGRAMGSIERGDP